MIDVLQQILYERRRYIKKQENINERILLILYDYIDVTYILLVLIYFYRKLSQLLSYKYLLDLFTSSIHTNNRNLL